MATLTDTDSLSSATTTAASASEIPPLDWAGQQLPDDVAAHPLMDPAAWDELRDSGRRPLDESPLVGNLQARAEFLVGAWIINEIVPSRIVPGGLLANLQPQMLRTVDVIGVGAIIDGLGEQDGAGAFLNAVLEPRRSAKTTTLWCILLGRCWMRAVYMAGYTMLTTAKKGGERFKLDVRDPITRKWRDKAHREKVIGIKLNESNGSLGVEFANGSKLAILSPNGDDVRSGAYDTLVMDEGGEPEPELWDDIVGAVVPSFDTRPGAQLIYAGTGGKYRDGSHFWATLHDPTAGRIRYGVPDEIEDADLQTWEDVRPLIEALHPGLDGLTNATAIARNFVILGWERFALAYLRHIGRAAGNDVVLSPASGTTFEHGSVPEGIVPLALAFAVHPSGLWTSVSVAWYLTDESGDLARSAWAMDGDTDAAPPRVGFKLVHHQEGNAGMPGVLWRLWKQTRLPIVHDDSPQEKEIIQQLMRQARPRPQVKVLRFAEKKVATTKLINGLKHGNARHWAQEPLDAAAAGAVRRLSAGAVLFGAPASNPEFDVTPLESAAAAVYALPDPGAGESFAPIVMG